jgi:hypothetical protein
MLIDPEDEELVSGRKWRPIQSPGKKTLYACTGQSRDGTYVKAHRLILGLTDPRIQGDHYNHCGLDNRRSNLRIATNQQNTWNRGPRKDGLSQYAGVGKDRGRWRARITVDGKSRLVGYFSTELEAVQARDKAARELHGEFAFVNLP